MKKWHLNDKHDRNNLQKRQIKNAKLQAVCTDEPADHNHGTSTVVSNLPNS